MSTPPCRGLVRRSHVAEAKPPNRIWEALLPPWLSARAKKFARFGHDRIIRRRGWIEIKPDDVLNLVAKLRVIRQSGAA
jgi:hypothetical protein